MAKHGQLIYFFDSILQKMQLTASFTANLLLVAEASNVN